MFCCAEMRCWRNDVCAMRKMMCRCAAMEGESSQGELLQNCKRPRPLSHLALLDASSPKGRALGMTENFPARMQSVRFRRADVSAGNQRGSCHLPLHSLS